MTYTHTNVGTCSKTTTITVEDGIIREVVFDNGCAGNLTGISRLCVGKTPEEVIDLLAGTPCGHNTTSCPDQLAIALNEMLEKIKTEN